jgi:hypothetical protein
MRPALDPAGHRVPRTKPTCLLHTWRPHRRPFTHVLHLHQHQSSRNLHLQYLAKNQSTQRCQLLITQGSDHPPVFEPHMVLSLRGRTHTACERSLEAVEPFPVLAGAKSSKEEKAISQHDHTDPPKGGVLSTTSLIPHTRLIQSGRFVR